MSDLEEEANYIRAVGIMVTTGRISTSYLQRQMSLGYSKAAKLVERAEADGIIAAPNRVGKRKVLLKAKSANY
jgi:S-DNA-T family DNA segregation ATPase FtsK/SpoIIIE